MTTEFQLIEAYFTRQPVRRDDVILGIGDDGAILQPPPHAAIVVSTDTLVEGVHFVPDIAPRDLGYRALAVNLSDLAAMGAEPAWATLAITAPRADTAWFAEFSAGFFELAARHHVQLVGGNMARGPLNITVEVHGFVPPGAALRRDGARAGDLIFVTGSLGDAALGLQVAQGRRALSSDAARLLLQHYLRPTPRVAAGLALRGLASACIDVSDGLIADLGHVLERSGVGATVQLESIPRSAAVLQCWNRDWNIVMTGGDDYELCFTVAPQHAARLATLLPEAAHIGVIDAQIGLRCSAGDGTALQPSTTGYDHFA